jgi:hypothetical protein
MRRAIHGKTLLTIPNWTAVLLIASITTVLPHTVDHQGVQFNYDELRSLDGKTACCNNGDCRPALQWWHESKEKVWRFIVQRVPGDEIYGTVEVSVPEHRVIIYDVDGKGYAHWCGYFSRWWDGRLGWETRCAFVPLKLTQAPPPRSISMQ